MKSTLSLLRVQIFLRPPLTVSLTYVGLQWTDLSTSCIPLLPSLSPHLHFNTNQFCFLLVPQNTKTKTLCFLLISKKLIKRQNPYEIAILFLAKKYIKFKVKKKKLTNALKKIIYKNFMEKKERKFSKKIGYNLMLQPSQ